MLNSPVNWILSVDPMNLGIDWFINMNGGDPFGGNSTIFHNLLITFDNATEQTGQNWYGEHSPIIQYNGSENAEQTIDFGEIEGLPQNTSLDLYVTAYCTNTHNEVNIFSSPNEGAIPQAISESHSIMWVTDNVNETTSAVNNSNLNNTTIDGIENALDDPNLNLNLLIDDIIGSE